MTRRALVIGGTSVLSAAAAGLWVATRSTEGGMPWPLRRVLDLNGRIALAASRADRLAPTFPDSRTRWPRVNGMYGLDGPIDPASWRLRVTGPSAQPARSFTLDEIRSLPPVEMSTELKCIEGWSAVVNWTGSRLSDVAAISRLATRSGRPPDVFARPADLLSYASLSTPDDSYYVGLDMPDALHPQTLLAYSMNGRPLTPDHGAPLRLVIPVKYGIKHIKRVGSLAFSDTRPSDFWAERGYDWHSGH